MPLLPRPGAPRRLAAARLVAPTTAVTPVTARHPVVLLPLPLRTSGYSAQRVVPVLRASRRPLTYDGLGARVRLLHLLPQLVTARVIVEAAPPNHTSYATAQAVQPSLRPYDVFGYPILVVPRSHR